MLFNNRIDAGQRLARKLATRYHDETEVLVLGLPRGGLVVAFEIAEEFHAPLDVFVVRKIGVPGAEELAMGAIASGNVIVRNTSVINSMGISEKTFQTAVERERVILAQREIAYRGDRPPVAIRGRSIILVDDGLATGASMKAAIEGVHIQRPHKLIVAVPVAARDTCKTICPMVDDLVCLAMPEPFWGVGQWYTDFSQTTDHEVRQLLEAVEDQSKVWAATP